MPNFEPQVLTVSQLNQVARALLEEHFQRVSVEGEISNLMRPVSGHLYFSLKDQEAQVRCAMFRGANAYLKFTPQNGLHVLIRGRVSLYVARGEFQLIVEKMEEAGEGLLRQKFERLKEALAEEGLFDVRFKKPLPPFPATVGVITSPTGAVICDILNVLKRRFPFATVIVYPTAVQGESAASQIAQALHMANQRKECDCLILARGGGSLEDLWPFNEEVVARAIFASQIPVVSGVGHETDVTIADFVADLRAPTPSVAAELVCPRWEEWLDRMSTFRKRLTMQLSFLIHRYQSKVELLRKALKHPAFRIGEYCQRLDENVGRLMRAIRTLLILKQQKRERLQALLESLSPWATLERGYAIVTRQDNGNILRSSEEVQVGEGVEARLFAGKLCCTVDSLFIPTLTRRKKRADLSRQRER